MKKIGAVLAVGTWLVLGGVFVAAQQPPQTIPVTVQVTGNINSQAPAVSGSHATTMVFASNPNATYFASHAPCDCKPMTYASCSTPCAGCGSPCDCQESCFSKFCRWLTYKPMPVPCECQSHCCSNCVPCVPPLYALFAKPGNCAPCASCGYATSCCFPH